MSFFKKIFSSKTDTENKTEKKSEAKTKNELNPEHKQIIELYTQKNPTPSTSKEIIESIAEELGKKPGGVRSILSKAGVYIKQEKLTWKNDKKLALKRSLIAYEFSELSEALQNDRDIAEFIVKEDVHRLDVLPEKFSHDKEFILWAIEIQEDDDQYTRQEKIEAIFSHSVCDYFKNDEELILIAWNNLNPETRVLSDLFLATHGLDADCSSLLKNKEFMLEAVNENPKNFECIGPNLAKSPEFLEIVKADDYLDYMERVLPELNKEHHKKRMDEFDDWLNEEEDEVIEIP